MTIAEKALTLSLAAARVNAELNQEEAAEMLSITAKTLRNYEKGYTPIPAKIFKKACVIYSVPEDFVRLPVVDDGEFDE